MDDAIRPSVESPVRNLTALDLQKLFRGPLGRLGISTPSLDECAALVIWSGPGPAHLGDVKRTKDISDKPHRYMSALGTSLAEVDQYWSRVIQHAIERSSGDDEVRIIQLKAEEEIVGPLRRLRQAMDECSDLVATRPKEPVDHWGLAAGSLASIFRWVVDRSGSNVHSGFSPEGPAITFVMAGLDALGWKRGNQPTKDAVIKYLQRNPLDRDNLDN